MPLHCGGMLPVHPNGDKLPREDIVKREIVVAVFLPGLVVIKDEVVYTGRRYQTEELETQGGRAANQYELPLG
jgi:hypothetical protein